MKKFILKWVVGTALFLIPAAVIYLITRFFGLFGLATCVVVTLYWIITNTAMSRSSVVVDQIQQQYPQWKSTKLSFTEEVMYHEALKALKEEPTAEQLKIVAAFINSRLETQYDFSNYTREQLDFVIRQAYNAANIYTTKDFDEFVDLDA